MIDWQALRDTTGILALLRVAEELGLDGERSLAGTRIDESSLEEPFSTARAWQELTLLRNLQALAPDPRRLGLLSVPHYGIREMGILGLGMSACETVEEAFAFSGKYQSFGLHFSRIRSRSERGLFTVSLDENDVPEDCQTFCIDRGLGVTTHLVRSLAAVPFVPTEVKICSEPPSDPSEYDRFFGVEVQFGATENRVVFAPGVAKARLPSANRKARLQSEHFCQQIRLRQQREAELDFKIRRVLARSRFRASARDIATELGMSSRSLRRHLAAQGTSVRALALASRISEAKTLLERGVAIQQVAARVGYAESASFVRAFRSFAGETPGEYAGRAAQRELG